MMTGVLLILLGLVGAGVYPLGTEPLLYRPALTLAGAAGGVALAFAAGRAVARRLVADLDRGDPSAPLRYARGQMAGASLLLTGYGALVFLGHWPLLAGRILARLLGTGGDGVSLPPLDELLTLAPLLASLPAWWAGLVPGERALRGPHLRAGAWLRFQMRGTSALGLVLLLMSAGGRWLLLASGWTLEFEVYPCLSWMGLTAASVGLFAVAPEILRRAWTTRPLPAGPLRDRLEACCARAGVRCRDLLVWDTSGTRMVNAFVAGVLPRFRYVFFSDALLERLDPEEIEAVLAHELGHAARRHLVWILALSLAYLPGAWVVLEWVNRRTGGEPLADLAANGLLLGVYFGPLFGHLSRRFETDADLYAARLLGDPMRFAAALQHVCWLAGVPPTRGGWRHPSPAERVGFLATVARIPAHEYGFRLRLRRLMLGLCALLLLVAAGVGVDVARQVRRAPRAVAAALRRREAGSFWERAAELADAGRHAEAAALLNEAAALAPGEPALLADLGDELDGAGRRNEAHAAWQAARDRRPRDLPLRLRLAERLGTD